MSRCKRCGGRLSWKRVNGKWHPKNLDGSDHWMLCKSIDRKMEGAQIAYIGRTGGDGYVWSGLIPPWHESLGDYRDFTDSEMQAREVCVYRP